jgi:hypothetical protein
VAQPRGDRGRRQAPAPLLSKRNADKKKTPAAIATPCDSMRAVSDARPAFAGLPRKVIRSLL